MIVLIAVVCAVLLLYVAVLANLDPNSKEKPKKGTRRINRIHPLLMFFLICMPVGLSYLVIEWNETFTLIPTISARLDLLVFRWQTLFQIIWIGCGILAALFYIYVIVFKRGYIYILAIPAQVGAFIFAWILVITMNGQVIFMDSTVVDNRTYHLVQRITGSGALYLFDCDDEVCQVEKIGFIDSSRYGDSRMSYDAESHTLHIQANTNCCDFDEFIVELDDD